MFCGVYIILNIRLKLRAYLGTKTNQEEANTLFYVQIPLEDEPNSLMGW
jgi:hypothetical protein